ncbi:MAG: IS21-like element helper ATPase IstB [Deltaproteobacteria bacterium]|nr:IS21-like element helper ATPase IstB [Deltaproteobacteria bacterium]
METKTLALKEFAGQLKLSGIQDQAEELIRKASQEKCSYLDFSLSLLETEINQRRQRDLEKRIKAAKLPVDYDLDQYDYSFMNGISKQQLSQLRECQWLEQNYNVVLMGPSGIAKTFIAAGLCYDALKMGYKAYFRTMEQINETLIMKDITRSAQIEYNKLLKANLLVIDDIMMFALEKKQAVQFFNFINHLHERASFIVTTNKSPQEWVKMLDDEVIATALLDRILYHCEVVRLSGKSYRLEHRKTIFN